MNYEFTKLSDVSAVETIGTEAKVLIEENGEIVKVPAAEVGTRGAVTSVNGKSADDNGAVEIEVPEQVQANWEQTNETAVDFVKGRTHYTYYGEEVATSKISLQNYGSNYLEDSGEKDIYKDLEANKSYKMEFTVDSLEAHPEASGEVFVGEFVYDGGTMLKVPLASTQDASRAFELTVSSIGSEIGAYVQGLPLEYCGGNDEINAVCNVRILAEAVKQLDEKFIPDNVKNQHVQPDWNQNDEEAADYVKGRTHYKGVEKTSYHTLREVTHNSSLGSGLQVVINAIIANHLDSSELIVELDGARYENVPCFEQAQYKMGGYTYYIVGNPYIFTDKNPNIEYEDNGLPFCVYYTTPSGMGGTILLTDTAATAMFEMYEENAVINPLPTEFLPTTVPVIPAATVGQTIVVKAVDENGKPTEWEAADVESGVKSWDDLEGKPFSETETRTTVVSETAYAATNVEGEYYDYLNLLEDIVPGDTYIVKLDDEEHVIVANENGVLLIEGDYDYAWRMDALGNSYYYSVPLEGTISISHITKTFEPIDEKFIPSSVPQIPAATVGQTVVVKAVDADGKPTEWEAADMSGLFEKVETLDRETAIECAKTFKKIYVDAIAGASGVLTNGDTMSAGATFYCKYNLSYDTYCGNGYTLVVHSTSGVGSGTFAVTEEEANAIQAAWQTLAGE